MSLISKLRLGRVTAGGRARDRTQFCLTHSFCSSFLSCPHTHSTGACEHRQKAGEKDGEDTLMDRKRFLTETKWQP